MMTKGKKYLLGLVIYIVIVLVYILTTRTPAFASSEKTIGRVRYIYEKTYGAAGRTDIYRNPVVEYKVGEKTYTLYRENMRYPHSFTPGDSVTIIYNPKDPEDANIYLFISYWISVTEVFVMLLLFLPVVAVIEGQYS